MEIEHKKWEGIGRQTPEVRGEDGGDPNRVGGGKEDREEASSKAWMKSALKENNVEKKGAKEKNEMEENK